MIYESGTMQGGGVVDGSQSCECMLDLLGEKELERQGDKWRR